MAKFTGEPGSKVSHYRLEERIGQGGMGTVYRATDLRSETPVAIKVLHEHLTDDSTFRERFVREAHHASRLTSPYSCRLLEYWEEDGRPFMAMEFVEGRTIQHMVAAGPIAAVNALDYTRQAALSLEEAHDKELIHRDIKPENIRVTPDGRVKVLDFGIARRLQGGTLTAEGSFIGTLTYAAPESFTGDREQTDHRCDLYSLGATLFDMLVGEPPFKAESAFGLIRMVELEAPPLDKLAGQSPQVIEIVRRCLEKKPADRYQKAADLIAAIEEAQRTLPTEEVTVPATPAETITAPAPSAPDVEAEETKVAPRAETAATPAPAEVSASLRPENASGRGSALFTLTLENSGGTDADVALSAEERGGSCDIRMPTQMKVPAGERRNVRVRVSPKKRRWRGSRQDHEFWLTADDGSGRAPPPITSGQFSDLPFFSGWVGWASMGGGAALASVGALAVLLLFVVGGGEDRLSLEEYFEEYERFNEREQEDVADAEVVFDDELAAATTPAEVAEALRDFYRKLFSLARGLQERFAELNPPEEVERLHRATDSDLQDLGDLFDEFADSLEDVEDQSELDAILEDVEPRLSEVAAESLETCIDLQEVADDNDIDVDLGCTDVDGGTPTATLEPDPTPTPDVEEPLCESLGVVSEQDVGDGITETFTIDCVFVADTFSPDPAPPPELTAVGVDFTVSYAGPADCAISWTNDIDFFGPDGIVPSGLFVFDEITGTTYDLAAAEGIAAIDVDEFPCDDPRPGTWYFFVDDAATRLILHHEGLVPVEIPLPPGDAVPRF